MNSIWFDTAQMPHFDRQRGDIKTDVLIIGGGIAGILCAHRLTQAGVDCVLAEADTICSGITKNTTAKLTAQHGLIYDKLIRTVGSEKARMYLEANLNALEQYRSLCADIECGFETKDAFVYSREDRTSIERELSALDAIGFRAEFASDLPLPFAVAGAVRFARQAQFHPLQFLSVLAAGLHILEHTRIRELAPHTAVTEYGTITADKIVVATHFPFLNKHGSYFLKLYQHRSYVIALEHAADVHGMYVDASKTGLSFRNYGNLLLLGGGSHRTGKQGGTWNELEQVAAEQYPNAVQRYRWATQDCMTLDGVPYIGRYSKRTPSLYVATGFNKWGMTSAMVSAMILTDQIMGRENPYAPVFSPSRTMLHPQLAANALEATRNLLTPSGKRCPHMGCALKWNAQEHTWDCPCHGSRFSRDGSLIDNPATGDLKRKRGS